MSRSEHHRPDEHRLLTGRGRFVDDQQAPGALEMSLVRSTSAHAVIRGIEDAGALDVPGVHAVVSGAMLATHLSPLPAIVRSAPPYYPLAVDRVRYFGEPVAVVLAEDRYAAEDGAEAVRVDLEPLTPILDPRAGERVWERSYRYGDPDSAFARAERTISVEVSFPRYNSTPLETYAVLADWGPDGLTVRSNFQGPFSLHPVMCRSLGLSSDELRLIVAEDIGGSFGIKAMIYPFIVLAGACSRLSGRPVKWVEDRHEHLLGSASGTNRVTRATAAVDQDGVLLAVRYEILEDVGGYLRAPEPSCVMRSVSGFAGPYAIEHGAIDVEVALTNKLPTGLNRGYGGQQHIFALERLMDAVARELDLDPAELRRRNLVSPKRFPFETASGTRYDSGDYEAALELVLERSDYRRLRQRPREAAGSWTGVGLATAVHTSAANLGYVTLALDAEARGAPGYRPKSGSRDWATASVEASGAITVEIATAGAGQGHRETVRRLAVETLGIDSERVKVVDRLDTGTVPWSVSSGSYSSRFAVMTGSAVLLALEGLRDELIELGAIQLGVGRDEVEWNDGGAEASAGRVSLRELAGAVHWDPGSLGGEAPGLAVTRVFSGEDVQPPDAADRINAALAYGFMADVAVVEVDRTTLIPSLRRYYAVHDVGRTLEPEIVAGQLRGAVIHGMGGALLEEIAYDGDGQPLAGDLMRYRCPEAGDAPEMWLGHVNVPSPSNPLGVKGTGESSAMSAPAAIAAAIEDALRETGVRIDSLPVDPAELWGVVTGRTA